MALFSAVDGMSKLLAESQHWGQVAWARYVWQAALLLPLFWRARAGVWRSAAPLAQVARGLLLTLSGVAFILGLNRMPIADCTAIGFVSPLLMTALAWPMLGEMVGWRRWSAVLVGFGGVLVVVRPGGDGFGWAAIWPLLSAAAWAVALVLTRRMRNADSPLTMLFYSTMSSLGVTSLLAPFVLQSAPLDWWGLAGLMGVLYVLGQWVLIRACQLTAAAVLAPINYSQMLWSTAIGVVVFGSWPDHWTWAGTAIIVASGLYIAHREARLARRANA